jgi:hypothetical protein
LIRRQAHSACATIRAADAGRKMPALQKRMLNSPKNKCEWRATARGQRSKRQSIVDAVEVVNDNRRCTLKNVSDTICFWALYYGVSLHISIGETTFRFKAGIDSSQEKF